LQKGATIHLNTALVKFGRNPAPAWSNSESFVSSRTADTDKVVGRQNNNAEMTFQLRQIVWVKNGPGASVPGSVVGAKNGIESIGGLRLVLEILRYSSKAKSAER